MKLRNILMIGLLCLSFSFSALADESDPPIGNLTSDPPIGNIVESDPPIGNLTLNVVNTLNNFFHVVTGN